MNYEISIHLYDDWVDTVKVIFRGSGHPLPDHLTPDQAALAYFLQTAASQEEALRQRAENEERLHDIQQKLVDNFETVILPDLRSRTGYEGHAFAFKWVYNQGEHIIEEHSSYRIPL
ncbi:hypothetical protein GXP70_05450 [Paenibacillus lycopersici]|uniref:Uncharacterized protein n=1 Tax=Paenibacillus lycopersici TaxID=2704462 RepID=A0A6C0FQQ9_9BACL|nr:hypothetical protein [Paenibacillus lycopersici]QHT59468.1 hypothetical protein GXP70_05450 [Paenibacillus lycopersici]